MIIVEQANGDTMKKYYSDYDRDLSRDRKWVEEQRDLANGARYYSHAPVKGSNLFRYQRGSSMDYLSRADMMSVIKNNKPNRRNPSPELYAAYCRCCNK